MPLPIITAEQRLQAPGFIKGVILGPSGIGKTSLLWTLDPATTLFVDLEAGGLSVDGWTGDRIDVRSAANALGAPTWEFIRGLACFLGGPDPAAAPNATYSREDFAQYVGVFGDRASLAKYKTIFFDSITVMSRVCFTWAKSQPAAFNKHGKPDGLAAYGLLGQEMKGCLTQLQHTPDKNVWMVGILDHVKDEFGRGSWSPQIEGAATGNALSGIVDQVISMVETEIPNVEGKHRAFVCHTLNPGNYPAKDRSRQLDCFEEPHLGKLMAKIEAKGKRDLSLAYGLPAANDPLRAKETETLEAVTGAAA
jgi:hypothetical protein